MTTKTQGVACPNRAAILIFFFTSGVTSLVLEVVWTRMLGAVFGNTVLASTTVLTAFMLGLALGAWLFGHYVDSMPKPLMLYGLLEAGIGSYAMLFVYLSAGCAQFYIWFYRALTPEPLMLNGVRFVLSLVLILPPTMLMGGTLPVLGRYLGIDRQEPGREVGYLYGANTLGGVIGCVVAGFFLIEWLGVTGALRVAGVAALIIGALALILGRGREIAFAEARIPARRGTVREKCVEVLDIRTFRLVLVAFGLTGFCSLAMEVLWTRVLLFLLTTTVYAFAVMLATFLTGMALGTFASSRWVVPRMKRPLAWFGGLEILVGLTTLISMFLLSRLEAIDLRWVQPAMGAGKWAFLRAYVVDAAVVLLLPTFFIGAAFPVVTTLCLRAERALGRRLGQAYAANTTGCVLGSAAAGFVLIPLCGAQQGIQIIVSLNLLVGVALFWRTPGLSARMRWSSALIYGVVGIGAFVLTPTNMFDSIVNSYHYPSKISFIREHSTGTVTAHDLPDGDRLVAVDGVDVAGLDMMLRTTQKMQGYIPLCLHPNPRRVVQIGFGSGETARVGMEFGVQEYSVVEICPAMLEAGKMFEEINHGSYKDPRVRKIIMDGKNFALLSGEKFDVVMNDSVFPGSSGSSAWYTHDHFRNCRERLAPGGIFSCWVPLDLKPNEMRMILKSFQEVFPHTSFWIAPNCLNKHGVILGSVEPFCIDLKRLEETLGRPNVKADLEAISIRSVYEFLDSFMCDEDAIRKMTANDPIHSDDHPRLEYSCALHVDWEVRLGQTLAMFAINRAPVSRYVVNMPQPEVNRAELARHYEATTHLFQGLVGQMAERPTLRRREFDLALRAVPGNGLIQSCERELDQEILDLQKGIRLYPGNLTLATRLADKLYIGMRYPEAAALYRQIIDGRSATDRVFINLAQIQFATGDPKGAETTLRTCLSLWPDSAESYDLLGGLYHRFGRDNEARAAIERAMRLEPAREIFAEHYFEITGQKWGGKRASM